MGKVKKKFKDIKEMLVFLADLRKRTSASLKQQKADLKRYDKLLKEEEAAFKEPLVKYKTNKK